MAVVALTAAIMYPHAEIANNERVGRALVFAMYDFHPMHMLEQNDVLQRILSPEIAHHFLLSNDARQLNVYLRLEMRPATPIILHQNNTSIIFTIDSVVMESDRIFQIDFTHRFGRVTSIREFELFPIPPTGIWNFEEDVMKSDRRTWSATGFIYNNFLRFVCILIPHPPSKLLSEVLF